MLTNLETGGVLRMVKSQGKRGDVVGARLNDVERSRWDRVVAIALERNPLAKGSDILRDFLFGTLGIVTDSERAFLLSGDENVLKDRFQNHRTPGPRPAMAIEKETGIDIDIIVKILMGDFEGIDPEKVKIVLDASHEKVDSTNVASIKRVNR